MCMQWIHFKVWLIWMNNLYSNRTTKRNKERLLVLFSISKWKKTHKPWDLSIVCGDVNRTLNVTLTVWSTHVGSWRHIFCPLSFFYLGIITPKLIMTSYLPFYSSGAFAWIHIELFIVCILFVLNKHDYSK